MVLLAPHVPIGILDAAGGGGLGQFVSGRSGGLTGFQNGVHVIIGSWTETSSFNPAFRRRCSRERITKMSRRVPRALSPRRSTRRSIGGARTPFGRCRLGWLVARLK